MKKPFSLLLATALASSGVLGLSAAAMAVDTPVPIPNADAGTSAIHVTKYKQGVDNNLNPTGKQDGTDYGDTMAGVTFTLEKVKSIGGTDISGFDYTKQASWDTLNGLIGDNGMPTGAVVVDTAGATTATTQDDGIADFTNLNYGVYKLTETQTPAGVTPAAPSYIVLPFYYNQTGQQQEWLTDVYVYPKNSVDTVLKEVSDKNNGGFSRTATYTLTTSTSAPNGSAPDRYVVVDELPTGMTMTQEQLASVKVAIDDASPFVSGTDYTITLADGGTGFTVEMTEAGREKIKTAFLADVTATVKTTFTADLTPAFVDGESETLTNTVKFFPNGNAKWWGSDEPGDETPLEHTVTSKFGEINITKVAKEDTGVKLAGAVFELYPTEADAKARTNKLVDQDGVSQWTTNDQGAATVKDLQFSTFYNGADQETAIEYWLVEVKAPEGRQVNVDPVKIEVDGIEDVTITNPKVDIGLSLPKTGATTVIVLAVAGGALAAGAFFTTRRGRKDEQPAE